MAEALFAFAQRPLGLLAVRDIRGEAAVAAKGAFVVEHRLTADGQVLQLTVGSDA